MKPKILATIALALFATAVCDIASARVRPSHHRTGVAGAHSGAPHALAGTKKNAAHARTHRATKHPHTRHAHVAKIGSHTSAKKRT